MSRVTDRHTDRLTDRQTPRTSVTIVSISCIRHSLKTSSPDLLKPGERHCPWAVCSFAGLRLSLFWVYGPYWNLYSSYFVAGKENNVTEVTCIVIAVSLVVCKDSLLGLWYGLLKSLVLSFFTRAHAASKYCFWRRLCVCVSLRTKSRKLLIRNKCTLLGICPVVNARSDWKLGTFDLELWPWELFSYFFHLRCISHPPLAVSDALT